jgi:hypothetical protein
MQSTALTVLIVALASPPSTVEQDGIRVDVGVQAHVYTWTVTNLDHPPITRFEVGHHNCYSQRGPEGWTVELEKHRVVAWTDDPAHAIRRGQSGAFFAQVSSHGAVLGSVPLTVGFEGSDEEVRLAEVWGPVPFPRHIFFVVSITIVVIAVFHARVVEWRKRGTRGPA